MVPFCIYGKLFVMSAKKVTRRIYGVDHKPLYEMEVAMAWNPIDMFGRLLDRPLYTLCWLLILIVGYGAVTWQLGTFDSFLHAMNHFLTPETKSLKDVFKHWGEATAVLLGAITVVHWGMALLGPGRAKVQVWSNTLIWQTADDRLGWDWRHVKSQQIGSKVVLKMAAPDMCEAVDPAYEDPKPRKNYKLVITPLNSPNKTERLQLWVQVCTTKYHADHASEK
jgi:hypothetical protein